MLQIGMSLYCIGHRSFRCWTFYYVHIYYQSGIFRGIAEFCKGARRHTIHIDMLYGIRDAIERDQHASTRHKQRVMQLLGGLDICE